jgi:xylulokinase
MERLALWLSMEDYILWQLSGAAATDYTMASRTMLFDQASGDWSPTMLAVCGISADLLPRPWPSGTAVGAVSHEAARLTGLTTGTPVATGGHDHLCGALAVGAVETGRFLDSSGTAQSMLMPIDRFHGGGDVFRAGFSCYRHVLRGRYLIQGGLNTAGGALEWVVKLTGGDVASYDDVFHEAEESGAGARGIFCLPHFRGSTTPVNDAEARAAFIGLHLSHGRGDMLRAVIEGLAYYLRSNLERMAQVGPAAPGHMLAIGGANRQPLVLQVKADVCNRPVLAPAVPEAVAVGAALLAGRAIGVFSDDAQAAASVRCDVARYEPDAARARVYETWYNGVYARMYPVLRELRDPNVR